MTRGAMTELVDDDEIARVLDVAAGIEQVGEQNDEVRAEEARRQRVQCSTCLYPVRRGSFRIPISRAIVSTRRCSSGSWLRPRRTAFPRTCVINAR
jgi:hypothetical protein